jgi:hypothetical protein
MGTRISKIKSAVARETISRNHSGSADRVSTDETRKDDEHGTMPYQRLLNACRRSSFAIR